MTQGYNYSSDDCISLIMATVNNISASTDADKADIFDRYFDSLYSDKKVTVAPQVSLSTTIDTIDITAAYVCNVMSKLDPSKAIGLDGIGPQILKSCAVALCGPLQQLFNVSTSLSLEWRTHCITPVFKSGNKTSVRNYRSISFLSSTSKVLERIIYDKIIDHIYQLLSDSQFGFIPGRCMLYQLLTFLNVLFVNHDHNLKSD
uniref:Reverse transcriptase domain-containing protein n=1 Tax=Amphimedon queenslandica TaxID=400682 RepID=A0A1X7V3Z7_AMPQE